MLNILYLYNSTQTYTNTVHEHLSCMDRYSRHRTFYAHLDAYTEFDLDLSRFDAIGIHYSVRLPFDQISPSTEKAFKAFKGLKFLFIQDEYNNTHRAWEWIKKLGLQLVFSVVPKPGMDRIYPPGHFDGTRFVSVLTGYVPDTIFSNESLLPPSQRSIVVGYRGRALPIQYGRLAQEKSEIGKLVKSYLDERHITNDIAWSEESRIYGANWHSFMKSCRAMLGSESGSNVFDWDGKISNQITEFFKKNPTADELEVYEKVIKPQEIDGIMNQISPRVFEAIAAKTVLVLFEGTYSDVIRPGEHFIALKKDGSNLPEVLTLLQDGQYVDQMAERAFQDIIVSGNYSYRSFVNLIDDEIEKSAGALTLYGDVLLDRGSSLQSKMSLTTFAIRAVPPPSLATVAAEPPPKRVTYAETRRVWMNSAKNNAEYYARIFWAKLPDPVRTFLKPRLKRVLNIN